MAELGPVLDPFSRIKSVFDTLPHPWLVTLGVAGTAVVLALLLFQVVAFVTLRLARTDSAFDLLVRKARRPLRLTWLLVVLQVIWHLADSSLVGVEVVRHITTLALIGATTWLLVRGVAAGGEAVVRGRPLAGEDPTQIDTDLGVRGILTRSRVLTRTLVFLIVLVGVSAALMTFPSVRQLGASLLASAGIAGVVVGFAARPVLSNLLAGLQIALTEPFRLNDVLVVEGEWGRVEEITGTYVVFRIWDDRRMVIPLQWFIEHPFQNWTRTSAKIIGSIFLWLDYPMPLKVLRGELRRLCEADPDWDGRLAIIHLTDTSENAMQIRALVSSANSARNWELRCRVREGLIEFIQRDYPDCLPRQRRLQQSNPG